MLKTPSRRPMGSARDMAEAAFKSATAKPVEVTAIAPKAAAPLPNAKELVSIRLERDVLEHFQADGAGWQERINAVLRRSMETK